MKRRALFKLLAATPAGLLLAKYGPPCAAATVTTFPGDANLLAGEWERLSVGKKEYVPLVSAPKYNIKFTCYDKMSTAMRWGHDCIGRIEINAGMFVHSVSADLVDEDWAEITIRLYHVSESDKKYFDQCDFGVIDNMSSQEIEFSAVSADYGHDGMRHWGTIRGHQ